MPQVPKQRPSLQPMVKTMASQAVPLHPTGTTASRNPPVDRGGAHSETGGCGQSRH